MSGQEGHHVSDASAKLSTRSGILTPVSDNLNNSNDGFGSAGRKRKRDGNTMDDLLKEQFIVKPYPSTTYIKPRNLQPLMLLPRLQLPLSTLDLAPSTRQLPPSRLYETHVKVLELEERMGSQPMVLIARLEDTRTIFAVERESKGLYVICQLGSWVNIQELKLTAGASTQELPKNFDQPITAIQDVAVPTTTAESNKYCKKKRVAMEAIQSMVKRPSISLIGEPLNSQITSLPDLQPNTPTLVSPPIEDEAPPTAAGIFENVRTQYFEALYLSKASLAYFAKGPLSRARAAFHLDYDSTLDLNDHIAFLESLVLSSTLIDKKYRDGVPNCISMIDIQDHSANEAEQAKTKKRKSVKKMKPSKNGLYPMEENLIRKWWSNHDDDTDIGGPGSSKEELTKSRLSQLRIRESQLQMIVILEVLALQPLASAVTDIPGDLPAVLPTIESTEAKVKSGKTKKPDHLSMLIDVHIDRLCIWQEIVLETAKAPAGDSQASENDSSSMVQTRHTDNVLRDFCVEVVAPFFSSRLPERCAAINRKLGGPVVVSPPKPKLAKSSSFSGAPSRPGAATKRAVPAVKDRRSFKRVLTDDREQRRSMSQGPNRAISLMRSATMPIVPGLKREPSEALSLTSIPALDSQSLQASRGGVLNSKRFSRREVDLSNMAPNATSKARKQAAVEAELKEAISVLRKPNREVAGKELVETAEKRSASASHSRKSRKPIHNPLALFKGVQITATPKANRQKNAFGTSATHPNSQLPSFAHSVERDSAPSSSSIAIPASSLPRIPTSSSHLSVNRNPLLSSIETTPTRKPFGSDSGSFLNVADTHADYAGFPPSSPLHVRRSSALLFNSVPDSSIKNADLNFEFGSANMKGGIMETPVKRGSINFGSSHAHPEVSCAVLHENRIGREKGKENSATREKEADIYKDLGWDDVDELA